ncbi:hypothetical protein FIBSPDRAFT_940817 [Athelia psychrophila]|uniref:Zn(2)-C6 fungal-type domain-containing protein n=1 Tax=Athelia psychrophila TaxID=1759441 RepID=A0A167VAG2_9AGAM|nr:hypothetical protein FIBSPDRAFT_940817 [Fibularhizoctonia sp. CBS 109695]
MPADPRYTSSSRKTRKLASEEDIELKRSCGEISCAECKRSKLKCDKKIPCGSCVRRGCSNVCPNGTSTSADSSTLSSSLPGTEKLHRKISEMGQRIRQLEDALAILQSSVSSEPHALLADKLLSIKSIPEPHSSPKDALAETMDAFGTLTIGESGEAKFFGPSAGSEALLLADTELPLEMFDPQTGAPALLNNLASMAFMGGGYETGSDTFEKAMTMLFAGLPPRTRAWSLCETYLEHSCWHLQLLTRQELIEDILTPIYNAKKEHEDPAGHPCIQISPYKFAHLYLVFAQGVLDDLTLPAFHVEGEKYHHYACAALALRPFIDTPEVQTVRVILLIVHYRSCAGERYTRDSVWALASLGCKLAQSIGMHRDPARWHMDEKAAEFRRKMFWEIYLRDLLQSLTLGRPPSIELSYVDCGLPTCAGLEDFDAQYWKWKYQFVRDVLEPVMKLTLSAAPPSYKVILELDSKVREMVLPPALKASITSEGASTYINAGSHMKSYLLLNFRSVGMLYIHRSFFAQALLGYPENPLRSPYATSFLATYRAASVVIRSTFKHLELYPELFMRWWGAWTQLFSSAIIVGSVATKAPSSSMASTAFKELGLAVDMFERGVGISQRARTGLAILKKLKEKASLALSNYCSGTNDGAPSPALSILNSQEDGTDELALFGGQTSVLVTKATSQKSPSWHISSSSSGASPSPTAILDQGNDQGIHPSFMQYMPLIPPTSPAINFSVSASNSEAQSLEQSAFNGSVPVSWNARMPGHSVDVPSQWVSGRVVNDPNYFDLFQQLQPEAPSTDVTALDTWGANDMTDLGQLMNVDSDMDWVAFMKECGTVNPATFGA